MPQTLTIDLKEPIARRDGKKITTITLRQPTLQELVEIGVAVRRSEFADISAADFWAGLTEKQQEALGAYAEKSIVAPADFKLFEKNLSLADWQQLRDSVEGLIVGAMAAAWKVPFLPFAQKEKE